MEIKDNRIDAGKAFDWGKTSEYYAKYRDIYPDGFYRRVADRGLCVKGQKVLVLGTGTGVLPRNMYEFKEEIDTFESPARILEYYLKTMSRSGSKKACRDTISA